MREKRIREVFAQYIQKAIDVEIVSNVDLNSFQKELLLELNEYCVNQVLQDVEVSKDPRKIVYKANQEFKFALIAVFLAKSLASPLRKKIETKEFFEENITIYMEDDKKKFIDFGAVEPRNVNASIFEDLFQDWMIYRDKQGRGIFDLIDEKTQLQGLDNYKNGGDPLYEFARFHRRFIEKEYGKELEARKSAQEAFRNSVVQTLAVEYSKQQLLLGANPVELIESLFDKDSVATSIGVKKHKIDKEIENQISNLLEYDGDN